ncbi:hypothetical protein FACS189494_05090 [Spirochaetia bacterium]|nr:hypothetical protein FACS189494_05090 [Spirochaetia bacterium]
MELFYKMCDKNNIVYGVDRLFNYMQTFDEKNEIIQTELFKVNP